MTMSDQKQQFLDQLKHKSENERKRFINCDLKTQFTGVESIQPLIRELINPNETPLVREQRYGVLVAIAFKDVDAITRCLFHEHTLISSTAAANICSVIDDNSQLKSVVLNDKLAPFVRRLILKNIKKHRSQLIEELVPQVAAKFDTSEAVNLLAYLPSQAHIVQNTPTENEKKIADILTHVIKAHEIDSYGAFCKRHPASVILFLEKELERLKGSDNTSSYIDHLRAAKAIFSKFAGVLTTLTKVRSDLVVQLIDKWFVKSAMEHNQQVSLPSLVNQCQYILAINNDAFVDLIISTIDSSGQMKDVEFSARTWKRTSLDNLIKIWNASISKVQYKTGPAAKKLINNFLLRISRKTHYDVIKSNDFYRIILQDKDRKEFAEWIANNIDCLEDIIMIEPSIGSLVASILLEKESKKGVFASADAETRYWQFIDSHLSDDDKYESFKAKTSNPSPSVRAAVLSHLVTCSLYHQKRVKETLEYLVKRLKNETEDAFMTVFDALTLSYSLKRRQYREGAKYPKFIVPTFANKENRQILSEILDIGVQKSSEGVTQFLARVISSCKGNREVFEYAVDRLPKNARGVGALYGLFLDDSKSLELILSKFEKAISAMIEQGRLSSVEQFLKIAKKPWKIDGVKHMCHKLFTEQIQSIYDQGVKLDSTDPLVMFAELWIDKMSDSFEQRLSKARDLIKLDASFVATHAVQKVLFGRNVTNWSLLEQFLQSSDTISYQDLLHMSTAKSLQLMSHEVKYFHFNPMALSMMNAFRYMSEDTCKALIKMLTSAAYSIARVSESDGEYVRTAAGSIGKYGVFNSHYRKPGHLKSIVKRIGSFAIEKDEQDTVDQFVAKFLSNDNETDNNLQEVTDAAVVGNAKVVCASYPSNHLSHLTYILENNDARNVMYFTSALRRICQLVPADDFYRVFFEHLESNFDRISSGDKKLEVPTNFSITIQKVYISFLIDLQNLPEESVLKQKSVALLLKLWTYDLHRDVKVNILTVAQCYMSKANREDSLDAFVPMITEALKSDYEPLVSTAFSQRSYFRNTRVAHRLFDLQIKALSHEKIEIQKHIWVQFNQLIHSELFIAIQSNSQEHAFFAKVTSVAKQCVLTMAPQHQHSVSDNATRVLSDAILAKPHLASTIFDQVVQPLFGEELQAIDDKFNAIDDAWDLPVSERRRRLIEALSNSILKARTHHKKISQESYDIISNELLLPTRSLVIHNCPDLYFKNLYSLAFVETNWTDKNSIAQGLSKLASDLNDYVELEDRSAYVVHLSTSELPVFITMHCDSDWNRVLDAGKMLLQQTSSMQSPIKKTLECFAFDLIFEAGKALKWPTDCRQLLQELRLLGKQNKLLIFLNEHIET